MSKNDSIEVKVLAHSISEDDKEIVTFELVYPRAIHSEIMTHRVFSRNGASSRAVPIMSTIDMVRQAPAMLSRYGANQAGMQDKGLEYDQPITYKGKTYDTARDLWSQQAKEVASMAKAWADAGYHKQVANRILEPFTKMKVVLTTTELENFFWLRDHTAADPTFDELAQDMRSAYNKSIPTLLRKDDWHVPYYNKGQWIEVGDTGKDVHGVTLKEALDISVSCCAQVSYRKLDDSLEKAERVISRLNLGGEDLSEPAHSSPAEHQGTPIINHREFDGYFKPGETAWHRDLGMMSGNLAGWIQYRQTIKGTTKW